MGESRLSKTTLQQVHNACINAIGEKWSDVVGYEGIYQVSTLGRVRKQATTYLEVSSRGEVISSKDAPSYILKQSISKHGYPVVGLTRDRKTAVTGVHRLVAAAFLPHSINQTEVHHIDVNPLHNTVDNLRWVTEGEHKELHRTKPRHKHQ